MPRVQTPAVGGLGSLFADFYMLATGRFEISCHKAAAGEQFAGRFYDAPHMFTRVMQDEAFAWFDRHLRT